VLIKWQFDDMLLIQRVDEMADGVAGKLMKWQMEQLAS
jgi:hypothetical protein